MKFEDDFGDNVLCQNSVSDDLISKPDLKLVEYKDSELVNENIVFEDSIDMELN